VTLLHRVTDPSSVSLFKPAQQDIEATIRTEVIQGVIESVVYANGTRVILRSPEPAKHEMAIRDSTPTVTETKPHMLGVLDTEHGFLGNASYVKDTSGQLFIITATHVIENMTRVVIYRNGKGITIPTTEFLCMRDLAYARAPLNLGSVLGASAIKASAATRGRPVTVLYTLNGVDALQAIGAVTLYSDPKLLGHRASTHSGSSGCAVIQNGRFVGVHGGSDTAAGTNWFTPANLFAHSAVPRFIDPDRDDGPAVNLESSLDSSQYDVRFDLGDFADVMTDYSRAQFASYKYKKYFEEIRDLAIDDVSEFHSLRRELKDLDAQGYEIGSDEYNRTIRDFRERTGYGGNLSNLESAPSLRKYIACVTTEADFGVRDSLSTRQMKSSMAASSSATPDTLPSSSQPSSAPASTSSAPAKPGKRGKVEKSPPLAKSILPSASVSSFMQ
jgi:hypothetical protein